MTERFSVGGEVPQLDAHVVDPLPVRLGRGDLVLELVVRHRLVRRLERVPAPGGTALPAPGTPVVAVLDWPRRHALMRMHTALHLLCSLLPGAAVTGGQIGAERSRLDLDLPEPPAREALEEGLRTLIAAGHPVTAEWVDEAVLDENPALVRTLSVQPPRGTGRLRLVRVGAGPSPVDLQPCGGTHVAGTAEIGAVAVSKIENKGRQNRRVTLTLLPPTATE